jgi:hypothetical protein
MLYVGLFAKLRPTGSPLFSPEPKTVVPKLKFRANLFGFAITILHPPPFLPFDLWGNVGPQVLHDTDL